MSSPSRTSPNTLRDRVRRALAGIGSAVRRCVRTFSTLSERFSHAVTRWTGSAWAFVIALTVVVVWAVTGPLFNFSNTWQLVINTGTTIATFLMVFLIQRSQNKDAEAIQIKLNEIIASQPGASNRLINVEELTEDEVRELHRRYATLAAAARHDGDLLMSHSIEEIAQEKSAATRARKRKRKKV